MPQNPGLVVSNCVLPALEESTQWVNVGNLRVYFRDLPADLPAAPFKIDVRDFHVADVQTTMGDRYGMNASNTISVLESSVTLTTGALNLDGTLFKTPVD